MSQAMPQPYETLLVERRDRVAIVTINRPEKRNALNIKTREEGAAPKPLYLRRPDARPQDAGRLPRR